MPNRLLELYRQQTNDPATDDQLILKWAKEIPKAMEMEDFRADYERLTKPAPKEEMAPYEPTIGDYFKQAFGSGVRAVAGAVASIPEAIGVNAAGIAAATGTDDQPGEGDATKPEERATYQLGQYIRQKAADMTPEPVEGLEQSMVASKIPSGLGSAAAFMAGGVAGKALKIPAWISTAAMGSASGATGFYEDAKASGATDKEAYLASLFGGIVGTSEAIPLARMVNRLDGLSGNAFSRTLIEAGKETFEEALQEASQQFAQNFTAKKLYDEDRQLLDGVVENATVGGATGFLFSLLTSAIGKRVSSPGSSSNQLTSNPQTPAGRVQAQPAPAAPPAPTPSPIAKGMEAYTEKPDGTQPSPMELEQLRVMARMELSGEINLLGKQYLDTMPAGMRVAYELVKEQESKAASTPAPEAPAVDPTVKDSLTAEPEETRAEGDWTTSNAATVAEASSISSKSDLPADNSSATGAAQEAPVDTGKEVAPDERQVQEGRQEELLAQTPSAETQMPEKPPQTITGSNVQTGTAMPVQQVGQTTDAGGAISPTIETRTPENVLNDLDLAYAVRRKRHGDISERAFFDIDPQPYSIALADKLTSLFRDQSSLSLSKQLVYFQAPDGKVYGLHSTKKTKALSPVEYRVTLPVGMAAKGKAKSALIKDLMAQGWVPVASSMTKTSSKWSDRSTQVIFNSREEFDQFRAKAYSALGSEIGSEVDTGFSEPESEDEGGKITGVSNVTPADELAASEGFTADEASALWPFISGTKMEEVSTGLIKALRDEDGRYALAKLANLLVEKEIIENEKEAFSLIGHLVVEARNAPGVGKEAFVKSLTREVGRTLRRGAEEAAAAKASEAQQDSGAGADDRAAGGGEQVEEADNGGEGVRYHTGTINSRYRAQTHRVASAFQETLLAAANAGLDVTVLNQEAASIGYEAGVANPSGREIALAMADVNNPSVDNLYHLNAEIAHTVFSDLSPAVQEKLQRAVESVTDAFLGVTNDFIISPAVTNRDAVLNEERLVDTVARKMVEQGFNPAASRSLASRFWQALKAALLRASMAFAKAFGFSPKRQATIAVEYLQVRVEQFLSGNTKPWGFVDFVGGSKLRPQDENRLYPFSSGYSAVNFRYDAETGATLVQVADPDSAAAILNNVKNPTIRYHTTPRSRDTTKLSPDTGTENALYDIAANNELTDVLNGLYAAWDASGQNVLPSGGRAMDAENFARWVMNGKALPTDILDQLYREASAAGLTLPDISTRLSDLNTDAQREAANRVYTRMSRFLGALQKRYDDSAYETSMEAGSEQRQYHRNALQAMTLTSKINDTNLVMDEIKQGITAMVRFLNRDISRVGSLSHKRGMYAEMINSLEGEFTADIGKQYAQAMNAIVRRFSESATESTNFVNILAKIADMPAYFGSSDAATIRNFIKNSPDPDFAVLKQNTTDSKALMTIAVAFAKRNALLLNMLSVRRMNAQAGLEAERQTLDEAIKIATGSGRTAARDALRHVEKLVTLRDKATRILVELERISEEQRILNDSLQAHRRFMAFHEAARRPLNERLAVYERMIGAVQELFEPYPGAKMIVPENPNEDPEQVIKREKIYATERDSALTAELQRQVEKMEEWLQAHPDGTPYHGGALYNRLKMQVDKIKENWMEGQRDKGSRSLISAVFGSMVEKFERTGDPNLKQISRSLRNFESWHLRYKQEEHTWATSWSKAAVKAREALGYSSQQMDVFLRTYYDPSLDYISRRLDIQASAADSVEAVENGLRAIRARYPQLNDSQWKALEGLLRETVNASDAILSASDEMGNLVKDEKSGIYRKVRGARLFEIMRTYSPEIQRVFKQMAGEPGKPGLWNDKPWDFQEVLADLAADKNAARSKYAAYFTGEIWETFFAPIANRSARSAFHAPDDGSGVRSLARVADVQAAFKATQKGDIIGFAENLYQITGGLTDIDAYIVDVMKTVNAFYKARLSAMVSDQSAAAATSLAPINQALMTARVTDEDPAEWLIHRRFDIHSVRSLMQQLTLHAAFGRSIGTTEALFRKAEESLADQQNILEHQIIRPIMEQPGSAGSFIGRQGRLRKAAKDRAAQLGYDLSALERASQQLAMLRYERDNFRSFIKSQGGIAMEFKWWSQLMSAFVSWTVQGPKTALVDTNSLLKPVQEIGLSTQSLQWFGSAAKHTALQNIGGFLETFGITLKTEADMIRLLHEHGQYPSSDLFTYKDRMLTAVMGNPVEPGASKLSRLLRGIGLGGVAAREILSSPIPSPLRPNDPKFVKVKPAVFTQVGQTMHLGAVAGTWRTFEDMVVRAARYLSDPTRAAELNDPTFKFTGGHANWLGYGDKFFGLLKDKQAFEALLSKLNQNGLTLEEMARDYLRRGMVGRVLTDSAYRKLMVIGPSEIMQESSIVARPSWMVTNPIGRTALPLVGWSMSQTASISRSFGKDISGEYAGYKKWMWRLVPILGVGLAYSYLSDWWDEEILKKKTNRLSLDGENITASLIDRLSASGVLGIAGDFANSFINVSTAREFSIDSRVFAVSSFTGIFRALSTYYHQGSATYATVGRPMLQAMGGSGAIQYLQVINGITGADNPEARATARVNVNNWLRVTGRELDMDVKVFKGGDFVPNRTTPFVREMVLAAYANSYADFYAAYRKAVQSAREDKRENPEDYVKRAFQYQHPLRSVFKGAPSDVEYAKLLRQMPESGRRDVMEAINLFNRYGTALGVDPFTGQKAKDPILGRRFDPGSLLKLDASRLVGGL